MESTWCPVAHCPLVTRTDGQKRPQLLGQLYCWAVLPQGTEAGLMQWYTLQPVWGATKHLQKNKTKPNPNPEGS